MPPRRSRGCDTRSMPSSRRPAAQELIRLRQRLPTDVEAVLADYERHLRLERNLSEHTVRAYLGDVVSLLGHLASAMSSDDCSGARDIDDGAADGSAVDDRDADDAPLPVAMADIDLAALRGWLGGLRAAGASRSTLARRSAAARTFTAWARRRG